MKMTTGNTEAMEEIDYKTLLDISQSTATVRTRDELLAFIERKVQPSFGFNEYWSVCLYNPKRNTLQSFLSSKFGERETPGKPQIFFQPHPVEGIHKTTVETNDVVQIDESWKNSPKTSEVDKSFEQVWRDLNFKFALSVSLRSFGQVIGTFHAMFNEEKAFTESQLQLFKSLAAQIAIALDNVLTNEKALEREREKALLLSTSEQMATIRDRSDLARVITKIRPLVNFDDAVIFVLSEDQTRYCHFLTASSDERKTTHDNLPTCNPPMLPVGGTVYEYLLTLPNPHVLHVEKLPARFSGYSDPYLKLGENLNNLVVFHLKWGDRLHGLLLLEINKTERLSESKLNLYKAVANQIAVAVGTILTNEEIQHLGEELRQRADELAKSNEAIARTSERLTELPDLSAFLGQLTIEAARQLNTNAGILLTYDERENSFRPAALFNEDKLFINDDIPGWTSYEDAEVWREIQNMRRPRQFDLVKDADLFCESFIEYHRERKYKTFLVVPLLSADKSLGCLGLPFSEAAPIDEQRAELVTTLAHQAALAIQLAGLADEAEQAAVAREQEKASRQRAESLASMDQALKNSFERLAEPDLNEVLGHILCEIVGQLRVASGCFWLHHAEEGIFTPQMYVTASEARLVTDLPSAEIGRVTRPFPTAHLPIWENLLRTRQPLATTTEELARTVFRGASERKKLARCDLKSIVTVPFIIGDEPLALFTLVSEDRQKFAEAELELVRRLAAHASIAIKLTRLADKARREAEQTAALDERNRIAREIHDALAQGFTGVIFQLETAKRVFGETTPAKVAEHVSRSIELAREGLAQARQSVQALRPPAENWQLDLPVLLREKLIASTVDTDIETEFSTTGMPVQFPPETTLNLLRIGQEAITNALRHSEARRITVELDFEDDGARLRVSDDGIGFETESSGRNGGYGLRGMRERAAAIKARLDIQSEKGSGTSVSVRLDREAE